MTTADGASASAVTRDGTAITDNDVTDGITVPPLLAGDHGIVAAVTAENGGERRRPGLHGHGGAGRPSQQRGHGSGEHQRPGPARVGETLTSDNSGIAAVSIVLPATTDCNATGAICTKDGRTLSNRLEFTINCPNG